MGRVHDAPFAHFTLQMAEDYDWPGLEAALVDFAQRQKPIPIRTVGLLTVTGPSTGIAIEPYRDARLAEFHAELWEVVTPFARGQVAPFYLPDRWVPHVTVKRCGPYREAHGRAMARLSDDNSLVDFAGRFAVRSARPRQQQPHPLSTFARLLGDPAECACSLLPPGGERDHRRGAGAVRRR